ncbi:CDP-glycerol glycerophosphotransferase family protein [Vagococcus lutrae]|uniref:CDP-glycerol glycerophosphotransferase family protein n=1 Tax=Vagococcus lutrae TaxID=81947 RepID=UPI00288C7251|nr:CDP-glycerol glycerophosphotransferase family protein [Vagococcus lutrae]MDT2811559.1 CDP-glycerol glycerophosphotransferase family protein [Vagococcus lutrae]
MKKILKRMKPIKSTESQKMMEEYIHYYESLPIVKKTILYESREGQSLTDSPYAIFKYLLEIDKEKKYHHIWTVQKSEELNLIINRYKDIENVTFVERNSNEYLQALASAEYLINNATFQNFFIKKEEQIYINTWHGTPLKTMGFDMPDNPFNARNVVRNFFISDYLLSPNNHTTNMYQKSYRLNDTYTGEILEYGYPRIDTTIQDNQAYLHSLFTIFNIDFDKDKPVILYAPTWKGKNIHSPSNAVHQIHAEMSYLRKHHGENYNILIKVHPYLYKEAREYDPLKPYLIRDVIDTNEMLSITDILITDYSSIFFDFLVTDKPIFFYVWDDDMYVNERGRYFSLTELPGPTSATIVELSEQIKCVESYTEKFKENYQRMKENFVIHDDGKATERYVNHIFNLPKPEKKENSKKNLLIYPGGMANNGITSSFINLVNNLDYSRYNVICFIGYTNRKEQIENIEKITEKATLLFRYGIPAYTKAERKLDSYLQDYGKTGIVKKNYPQQAYIREMKRLIGHITIDIAIDFSGYSIYPAKLILALSDSKKVCFIHSDIVADKNRTVDGKKPHEKSLTNLFTVYNDFDVLLSVSKITNDINREKLKNLVNQDKFKYSVNTLNPEKVLSEKSPKKTLNDEMKIEIINQQANVIEMAEVYEAVPINQSKRILSHIEANSEVEVIAKATYLDEVYYKVRLENIYRGWIAGISIKIKPDTIVSTEKVDYFALLNTSARCYLYSRPYNIDGCYTISTAGFLRNLYVNIDEIVSTSSGEKYFCVSVYGEKIGWLNLNTARLSKRLNGHYSPITTKVLRKIIMLMNRRKYRKKKALIENRLLFEEKYEGFAQLHLPNNDKIVCFEDSHLSQPLVANLMLESSNQLVRLLKLADFQGKKVYKIQTPYLETAWVESHYVEEIELSDKEPLVFKEESLEARILLKEGTGIYPSKTATVFSDSVKKTDDYATEKKIYRTDGKELLQLEDKLSQGKISLVDSRQAIFDEINGTFNFEGMYVPYPRKEDKIFNFVTVGRLSPEKQHQLLIKAFAEFYKQNEQSHLYIVGSGAIKDDLQRLVSELQIQKAVTFTGQLSNPYPLMKRCNCFVLTSAYEGQPMVLLESLTLGLPIISTDIPACRYVLQDGAYGLLTKTNDVEGIKNEMIRLYENKDSLNFKKFDYQAYNEQAIEDFYKNIMK